MRYRLLVVLCLMVVAIGVTTPAWADPNLALGIYYDLGERRSVDAVINYSIPLLEDSAPVHPSLNLIGVSNGYYGLGISLPISDVATPLFRLMKVTPAPAFMDLMNLVEIGGAVTTTKGFNAYSGGLYTKAKMASFDF